MTLIAQRSLACSLICVTWCSTALAQSAEKQTLPAETSVPPIVARYEAWRGGEEFRKLSSLHTSEHLKTNGLTGSAETWSTANGNVHQDTDLGAFKQRTVVGRGQGWTTALSGQIQKLSGGEASDASHDGEVLFDGVFHGGGGAVLTSRPQENSDSHRVDVIRVGFTDGSTYDYRLSPHDGSLLSIQSAVNGRTLTTSFSDWRMVDGVRLPFSERVTGVAATDSSTSEILSVQVNPVLSDALFAEPADKTPGLFTSGPDSSGWLPFEFFNGTRLFIPATINAVSVKVLLDSGASSTIVDQTFAKKIGLKPAGAMTGEGTGGSDAVSVLNGVTLQLGTLSLSGQTMVATDLDPLQQLLGHPLPVILGNEVFQDAVVDIDFAQHRICFRNPKTFVTPAGSQTTEAQTEDGIHVINASVEGRPALLQCDLGNGSPLLLYSHFWDQAAFLTGRPTSMALTGGFGGLHPQKITMVRSVTLGGGSFVDVPTSLQATQSSVARSGRLDGNIGMPFLSRFHLIIDFPHDRVLFAPPMDTATSFDVNHAGLSLGPTKAGAKIIYVAPQSPASQAGLNTNDIIISVDGNSLSDGTATSDTRYGWRFGAPGETHLLGLSDGKVKKLTLAQYF